MAKKNHPKVCYQCKSSFLGRKDQKLCGRACFKAWSVGNINKSAKTDEHKHKISLACLGRIDSDETKLKKSLSHRGPLHYRWNVDRVEQALKNKLGNHLRKMLKRAITSTNVTKDSSTFKMLGYTPQQLREHIESQFEPWMNWSNWGEGSGTWQIDHIRLLSSFPAGTPPAVVNALNNLRPLSYEENMKRPKFERSYD